MSIADKLLRAKEDYDRVFEAGKKAEWDAFWDAYQDYGNRVQYPNAFYMWDDTYFKPKYPIRLGTITVSETESSSV
jgi:hypothetical protein